MWLYTSRKGYSLIEGPLFLPESWFDDEHAIKRKACAIPDELEFQTMFFNFKLETTWGKN
jgi:hypothetical protein